MDLSLIFVPLNELRDTRKWIRNGCFKDFVVHMADGHSMVFLVFV